MRAPVTKDDIGKWAVAGRSWTEGMIAFQITSRTDYFVMNGSTRYLPVDIYGLYPDYESALRFCAEGTEAVKVYEKAKAKAYAKLQKELDRIFPEPKE